MRISPILGFMDKVDQVLGECSPTKCPIVLHELKKTGFQTLNLRKVIVVVLMLLDLVVKM